MTSGRVLDKRGTLGFSCIGVVRLALSTSQNPPHTIPE